MTPATFLENFDLLADAPNAIARLRELILQLAVHGKLVPEVAGEEDATVLLDRISGGGENPVRGRGRRRSGLPPVDATRLPYPLPSSWVWARFGQVAAIRSNLVPPDEFGHLPHVAPDNIEKNSGRLLDCATVADDDVRSANHLFHEGQILYSKIRPRLNKVTIAPFDGLCSADMYPIDARIDTQYLALYMLSGTFLSMSVRDDTRVAMPKINQEQLGQILVAVPPLAEQRRIVAKVDELMKRCDALAARQQARNERRTALVSACLHALTIIPETRNLKPETRSARSPDFILHPSTFNLLFATPEAVRELRKTILQLAVQGRLVPQDPNDEPADTILASCLNRQEHSDAVGSSVPSTTIDDAALPSCLPSGWKWARLGWLGTVLGGGTPSKLRTDLWSGDLPWVSPKDMKVPYLTDAEDHISTEALSESAVKLIPCRSVLVVVRGMILAHSFPAAVNEVEVTINQDMKALVPFSPEMVDFLLLACRGCSSRILGLVERSSHGTCRLDTDKLFGTVIGIPPFAEQKRIVAKVNELMALCDALEAKLSKAREDAGALAAAVVHEMFAPRACAGGLSS